MPIPHRQGPEEHVRRGPQNEVDLLAETLNENTHETSTRVLATPIGDTSASGAFRILTKFLANKKPPKREYAPGSPERYLGLTCALAKPGRKTPETVDYPQITYHCTAKAHLVKNQKNSTQRSIFSPRLKLRRYDSSRVFL